MESVFERMLRGDVPACFLIKEEECAAILEPNPAAPGHAVIFPTNRTDALFDMTSESLAGLMLFAQRVGRALKSAVPCDKIALVAYGIQVRHVHLHLIPARGTNGEINLEKARQAADPDELERIARLIRPLL